MALPDNTKLALVPATAAGEETSTTWAAFKAEHPDLKADGLKRIEDALEAGISCQHQPAKDAPVLYIVRR